MIAQIYNACFVINEIIQTWMINDLLLYDIVILLIYFWYVCVYNLWKEEIKNEWMKKD